jgi:hypothetical protein
MRASQRGRLPHHGQLAGSADAPIFRAPPIIHCGARGAEFLLSVSSLRARAALRMVAQKLLVTPPAAACCFPVLLSFFTSVFAVSQHAAGACTPTWVSRSSGRPALTKMRASQRGCLLLHEQPAGAADTPLRRTIPHMHFGSRAAEFLLSVSTLRAGAALRIVAQLPPL